MPDFWWPKAGFLQIVKDQSKEKMQTILTKSNFQKLSISHRILISNCDILSAHPHPALIYLPA